MWSKATVKGEKEVTQICCEKVEDTNSIPLWARTSEILWLKPKLLLLLSTFFLTVWQKLQFYKIFIFKTCVLKTS